MPTTSCLVSERQRVADRIRNLMITKGVNQEMLARHIGCSKAYISKIVNLKIMPNGVFLKMLSILEGRGFRWFLRRDTLVKEAAKKIKYKAKRKAFQRIKRRAEREFDKPYNPAESINDHLESCGFCEACQGDGLLGGRLCPKCDGEGRVPIPA